MALSSSINASIASIRTPTSTQAVASGGSTGPQYAIPMPSTFPPNGTITVKYQESGSEQAKNYTATLTPKFKINDTVGVQLVPSSFKGVVAGRIVSDDNGKLMNMSVNPPVQIGTVDSEKKEISITDASIFSNTVNLLMEVNQCIAHSAGTEAVSTVVFRAPGAPIRSGSLTVQASLPDGSTLQASSDFNGLITGSGLNGAVDFMTGIGRIDFGTWVVDDLSAQGSPWYNANNKDNSGNVWKPSTVYFNSVKINCVVSSYLPLSAKLLGLDPVRLPIDGKVPIFRDGGIVVIHNTQTYTCPDNLVSNQSFNVGRTNLSFIELYDQDDVYIPDVLYTVNLETGAVTMASGLNLTPYQQPLKAVHRIEDMVISTDVQITGHIGLLNKLTHDYPANTSFVSSVLAIGDMQSKCHNEFTQKSWTGVWQDELSGDDTLANFDFINHPIAVSNRHAIKDRYALIFTNSTSFNIVSENMGIIGTGNTGADVAPVNPNTGGSIFTMNHLGFGTGWASGNVIRFNIEGCNFPIWYVRTTLQGPATLPSDNYITQNRGDSS